MSTQSTKSPTQEDLPKEQEEEETKQNPENPQEQSKEDSREDTNVATALPPSSSSAEKESSPSNATMSPLQEAAILLLSEFDILSASDDEKEDTSPQESSKHSSTSAPPTVCATPSKRPFDDTNKDEDESQGKEKKKKEEPDGGDTKDKKPKEAKPLEPYLVRLSNDVETEISFLRSSLDYHTDNNVLPFEDSLALQDFMTNWLHVDVLESDLLEEIEKLKKKFVKVAEEIGSNMNALEPRDRLAFDLAQRVWSTQTDAEDVLDVEPVRVFKMEKKTHGDGKSSRNDQKEKSHGDGEGSRTDQKEMSIIEAETIFLNGLVHYNIKNGRYPFENDNSMADFIRNWVLIDFPAEKFMQMIEGLRRKYDKKGRMLKNVDLLGPRERDVFDLAEKIWGNRIGN